MDQKKNQINFEPLLRKKKRNKLKKTIIEQNSTIQYEIQSMLEKFSPYNGRNNLDSFKNRVMNSKTRHVILTAHVIFHNSHATWPISNIYYPIKCL